MSNSTLQKSAEKSSSSVADCEQTGGGCELAGDIEHLGMDY